jgi:hypothetical protein
MSANPNTLPRSIDEYLTQLRRALAGADAALIQDALSDAETHLRAECTNRSNETEESVLKTIMESYGLPEDVATAYLDTDQKVQAALAPAAGRMVFQSTSSRGWIQKFFGAYGESRNWTCLLLMLMSLVTGVMYFSIVVTGLTVSLGLSILIIGLPVFIGFIGLTRILALVEGRLVEAMTGERMPRRVRPPQAGGWTERLAAMLKDRRTWTTMAYQLLALPLGVVSFAIAVIFIALGIGLVGGGTVELLQTLGLKIPGEGLQWADEPLALGMVGATLLSIGAMMAGLVVLTSLLHLARITGQIHGRVAKLMLVAV